MIDDIKAFSYYFNIVMQVMYFAYLLYAIGTDRGILWLNIALAGLSILYFVFYVATYNKKDDTAKQVKKSVRNLHRWCKLGGKTLTLCVMVSFTFTWTPSAWMTTTRAPAWMVSSDSALQVSEPIFTFPFRLPGVTSTVTTPSFPISEPVTVVEGGSGLPRNLYPYIVMMLTGTAVAIAMTGDIQL